MTKKIVSVHIDIAELVFIVSRLPQEQKSQWLDDFCETLVLQNGKNDFAEKLLDDVREYQEIKSQKARESALARWGTKTKANASKRKRPNANVCERMQPHTDECEPMRNNAKDKKEQKEQKDKEKTSKKESEQGNLFDIEQPEDEFNRIWELYGKKGNKKKSISKWLKIKQKDKDLIFEHVPQYVLSTPDIQFRKNFETYLNNECWNDKIVSNKCEADSLYKPKTRDDGKPLF